MKLYVGVDLGGTHTKIAAVEPDGTIITRFHIETRDSISNTQKKVNYWVNSISSSLEKLNTQYDQVVEGVGIAAPGLVDQAERTIAHMPGRLSGLEQLDWKKNLKLDHPVPVINDAQAALLAEGWIGAAKNLSNVVLFTLGTGVGGALMLNDEIHSGTLGRAGHLGHISLDIDGGPDICGMPGSLENIVGQSSLSERSRGCYTSYDQLTKDYQNGNSYASEIWLRSVKALATGVASVINVIDPDAVLLGGGISTTDELVQPLTEFMKYVEWRPYGEAVPIRVAQLGAYGGAIGAARKAMLGCNIKN